MLSREQPDRIHVAFDDHRLVANAGLILPVTLAHHLGLGELVDNYVDLGRAPGRANAGDKFLTLVASALAGWRLHRRRRRAARRGNRSGAGLCNQGAVHAGNLPAEFPVGPCPPTGSGEPAVAGAGLGRWSRTWR